MHILNANQRKALDNFISKIPESTVKGNYERWNEKIVSNNERITSSDMDSFIALSHNLDADLQHFPQEFSYNVKNYIDFGKTIPTAEIVEEEVATETPKKKAVAKKAAVIVPKKAVVAKKVVVPVKAVVKKKK